MEAHHWLAPLTLPGTPGLSGSAGRTRSWPGRAVVLLGAVSGPEYDRREQINRVLATSADGRVLQPGPGQLLLILPMQDPSQIEGAGRLCVTGFSVRGDEGGTWTGYREIELSPR
ncbi:hypothetical protein SL003B_3867 [Polymorphum gilvum SL003B-26A1]|uniref:Uncharacterized protein n=1 Tax=Polymorphum gilvum (strain LMG 25793 / CGMCC 1.9160 / SL003B-26A1) TaxID=991905 RepID=F2J4N5_POLGS|nr:hypothetical protein SL003B_3867 [Polymorphum gilvum SL003B-26A1]